MVEPSNSFERRAADGGGWPRAPRWMLSSWYVALMALAVAGNGWVAAVRWLSGDGFGGLLAAAVAVSLCLMTVVVVRTRQASRHAQAAELPRDEDYRR